MLEVKDLNVYYGELHILWDLSIKVEKNEIVAIIGPNGAGKTTLLKTISGLLKPKSGSITYMGKRIDNLPPHKVAKLISHVPEGRKLFPYLTVRENLELGASTEESKRNIEENLKRVYNLFPRLKEREKQLAVTLSGGEQQMLAIGRGLMSETEMIMLDEPSLGLAPLVVDKIFEVIQEIVKSGKTVLLVEQNVHRSLKISNRTYVIEDGRIVKEGNSRDLVDDPYIKKVYLGF